jgi:hypothetical protein
MPSLAEAFDPFHFEIVAAHRAPLLAELVAYWRQKQVAGRLPRRADIDPAEIKAHLPLLFMVDVLQSGGQNGEREFRYRLIGTELVQINGRDSTGKTFTQVYGDDDRQLTRMHQVVGAVVDTGRPVLIAGEMFWRPDRAFRPVEAVLLPLSADGKTIDVVMGEIAVF